MGYSQAGQQREVLGNQSQEKANQLCVAGLGWAASEITFLCEFVLRKPPTNRPTSQMTCRIVCTRLTSKNKCLMLILIIPSTETVRHSNQQQIAEIPVNTDPDTNLGEI